MARPPVTDDETHQRAKDVIENSADSEEVRAAQAYLLPAEGLSLEVTAMAVGRDRYWVSRARNRFIKGLAPVKHGGRRNELFSEKDEIEIVKAAFIKSWQSMGERLSPRDTLRELLDERLGHTVSDSTITEMLGRMLRRYVPGEEVGLLWRFASPLGSLFYAEEDVKSRRTRYQEYLSEQKK